MNLELTGRRAIVTGGSRGIGLAVARTLVAEGANVALVARGAEALEEAAHALSALASAGNVAAPSSAERHPGVIAVPADTGSDDSITAMVSRVADEFGGVDILVNAAATPNRGAGFPESELEEHLNVKLGGYLRCARAVAPLMANQGWGRIVNVSGLAARQTGSVVGSVRNVAVAAMSKNLADELGPSGINVNVVHPGSTVTERAPDGAPLPSIGRYVTADEVADVIVFLCSPRSVAVNGDAITVGGGVPGAIHY